MSDDIAIFAAGLSRRFGTVCAVREVSLSVRRGEIFGLVGPDGAGKSTMMRMLAGVLPPDTGRIIIAGVDVVADPEAAKEKLSYMPQRFGLYEDLTVAENIFFYAEMFGVPRALRRRREGELLAAANLGAFRARLAGRLSGGMKQKLGLVCALIHTPEVLLLDEPTTGVDPVSRRDFWAILYGLRDSGVTTLLSTAYMDEAERCSRLALMGHGEIRRCDTPARLKQMMPGMMLAVSAADPRAVKAALEGAPGVLGLLLMGDRVHVRVDDAPRRLPCLQTWLAARGVSGADIAPIRPSIEDVFVALDTEPAS
ncbi:MAG TPA: ABC transporter ATP-binding protein [Acidocella sp.]|jgi:ABC-2 type transport system ATP-binding protein|uniref:ABC transporter ATP-binding protein n=1 Tax=Acidocella sp. TaxID=50710 RepID=UPI002C5D1ECE|nr:ABC transporter ATP-binding protein [Acidocella sp.]HVE21535.1 ABC transporter ATP-binding protein [Acidocella sp.]